MRNPKRFSPIRGRQVMIEFVDKTRSSKIGGDRSQLPNLQRALDFRAILFLNRSAFPTLLKIAMDGLPDISELNGFIGYADDDLEQVRMKELISPD